jgi:hypothetical protein
MTCYGIAMEIQGLCFTAEDVAKAAYSAIVRVALFDMQNDGRMCVDIQEILNDLPTHHLSSFFSECCVLFEDFYYIGSHRTIAVDVSALMREKHDMLLFLVSDYVSRVDTKCDMIDADNRVAIQCIWSTIR